MATSIFEFACDPRTKCGLRIATVLAAAVPLKKPRRLSRPGCREESADPDRVFITVPFCWFGSLAVSGDNWSRKSWYRLDQGKTSCCSGTPEEKKTFYFFEKVEWPPFFS